MEKKKNLRFGFTLIELLVVIAIIGLLSSVVIASLNTARAKGRDAKRLSDVRQIKTALELYFDQNGFYPTVGGAGAANNVTSLPVGSWLATIPKDPLSPAREYSYAYMGSPANAYEIYVSFEVRTPAACTTGAGTVTWTDASFEAAPNCGF